MAEDEINLLDYGRVLLKHKKLIVSIVAAITLTAIIYSLLATKIYRAQASIMPIGGQRAGQLTMLLDQTNLGGLLGGGGPDATSLQLIGILGSSTLTENVIAELDLLSYLFGNLNESPPIETAVKRLLAHMTFEEAPKTKLLMIKGDFEDAQLASRVVNTYLKELAKFLISNELTTAKRHRVFIEGQLEQNNADLLEAGKHLARFYSTKQVPNRDSAIDIEVSVNGPKNTNKVINNNDSLLKSTDNESLFDDKIHKAIHVKDVPQQVYLEYLTQNQELLRQVNALLTQQYEMAKIEESKEDLSFQVIDWGRVPHQRFKPKRKLIVSIAFVLSLFIAMFCAFFLEYLSRIRSYEQQKNA